MEIHRFEKVWTVAAIVLIVAFISTIVYGAIGPGIAMINESGGTIDSDDLAERNWDSIDNFQAPTPTAQHVSGDHYEVYVIAQRFRFSPGTGQPIQVPAHSTVTFHVASPDVMHSFEVVGTNVNVMVLPGQVSQFNATFQDPATYSIVCAEYCGKAHHLMEGSLEVVPQAEFDGGDE